MHATFRGAVLAVVAVFLCAASCQRRDERVRPTEEELATFRRDGPVTPFPLAWKMDLFRPACYSLARNDSRTFNTEQALLLFGEPDVIVSPKQFAAIYDMLAPIAHRRLGHPVDAAYDGYRGIMYELGKVSGDDRPPNWEDDEQFLRCAVWLYKWPAPEVYKINLDPYSGAIVYAESYLLLVRDNQVLRREAIGGHRWLAGAERKLAEGGKGFDAKDFQAVFGRPDMVWDIKALADASPGEGSLDADQTLLVTKAFDAYTDWAAREGPAPPDNWRSCDEFLACRLIVYQWHDPDSLRVGSEDRTQSYFFLVGDGAIFAGGYVVRGD